MSATSSGSDTDELSGIDEPTLLEKFKRILDQYRNDVQIIKELVQNADDANATVMKVLYDGRTINSEEKNESPYRKFLRGPALVFFNDAQFTEKDWKGIKSINKSMKKDEPLKIGQFGLGFKSIFHLTDYPCIISGDRLLFIDPQEKNESQICNTVKLRKIRKAKKHNVGDYLNALDGLFGFSKETFDTGFNEGTIFWFPLRQVPSKLSDDIYRETQVNELLQSFLNEGHRSLLFLKTLCSIEVFVNLNELDYVPKPKKRRTKSNESLLSDLENINFGRDVPGYRVLIDNKDHNLVATRKVHLRIIEQLVKTVPVESKYWVHDVEITTERSCKTSKGMTLKSHWLLVNFLKGGEISSTTNELMNIDNCKVSHLTGFAALICEQDTYSNADGHLFCYQPLPQDQEHTTGLPVHINGFFALTQDRRNVRWPDKEDKAVVCGEKKIQWNLALTKEIMPDGYSMLIQEMVNLSKAQKNPNFMVNAVYYTLPDTQRVQMHWKSLSDNVLANCKDLEIVYTKNNNGRWIRPDEAIFVESQSQTCTHTIVSLLLREGINIATVPEFVLTAFKKSCPGIKYLTQQFLKHHLMRNHGYKNLKFHEKEEILHFLLDGSSADNIDQLELLPLANGSFTQFSKKSSVFLESKDTIELFPKYGGQFVSPQISQITKRLLQHLLENHTDRTGLHVLSDGSFASLIEKTMKSELQYDNCIQIDVIEIGRYNTWLKKIWELIQRRFSKCMDSFSDLPIFPVYGVTKNTKLSLHSLKSPILRISSLRTREDRQLVLSSLKLLSITFFDIVPKWINFDGIKEYIHTETADSLEQLFSRINDKSVYEFNHEISSEMSSALLEYLSDRVRCELSDVFKRKIQSMKLFEGQFSKKDSCLVSLKENNKIYTGKAIPVPFIERTIVLHSESEISFARSIQGQFISDLSLVYTTLANAQKYNYEDQLTIIRWVIIRRKYIDDEDIRNILRKTKFLRTADGNIHEPQALFDPSDTTLCCLFKNRNMVPVVDNMDQKYIDGLKRLGLKSKNDLSTSDIVQECTIVHEMAEGNIQIDKEKCKALLHIMNENSKLVLPELLNKKRCIYMEDPYQRCSQKNLKIPQKLRKPFSQFCFAPEVKTIDYAPLVSSVHHLMECNQFPKLSRVFCWTVPPEIDNVARQLLTIVQIYESRLKPELLPIVTHIYKWFREQGRLEIHDIGVTLKTVFFAYGNRFVWVGNGFQAPDHVFTERKENDVNMDPFITHLPDEYQHLSNFFLQLGCQRCQSYRMYVLTLDHIRQSIEQKTIHSVCSTKTVLCIIIAILNKIKQHHFEEFISSKADLFFPVVCHEGNDIMLKSVKECAFCDAEWLRDIEVERESGIFCVHPDVPITTAKKLGVCSLTSKMLTDTEAFDEWGQEEPLTRRIKTLLKDGYTDGFSIAKELLQNADDAKAKKFWILYDERENKDARSHLLSEGMAEFQGPAIWVYNEARFSSEDLRNITQLYGETKKDDASKIGKFGLGFCAVYNITDVPSFVTGSDFVVFDPHTNYLGSALPGRRPGLKISLNPSLVKRFKNQFKPFEGIFGCNLMTNMPYFDGTLFRLPLRTMKSEISKKLYTPSKVEELFKKIMDLSANMLIFNQNIQEIKLFHIPKSEKDPRKCQICFEVAKNTAHLKNNSAFHSSVVAEVMKRKAEKCLQDNPLKVLSKITIFGKRRNDIISSKKKQENVKSFSGNWLVSWSTCTVDKSISHTYEEEGTLPLGSIAVPIIHNEKNLTLLPLERMDSHFYTTGHLFFFLPLPIEHNFPFHINGQFLVTSDRRHLKTNNEDDMNLKKNEWNENILQDSVMHALLYMLENVSKIGHVVDYNFTQLWPRDDKSIFRCLQKAFYTTIVKCKDYEVFESHGKWLDISKCVFLDEEFLSTDVGAIAFDMLSFVTKNVVKVPTDIYQMLYKADREIIRLRTVMKIPFFLEYFLPRLQNFGNNNELKEKRNRLLLYALQLREHAIDSWLNSNQCIPSCPHGTLMCPSEMIDPFCQLANLFEIPDAVFPDTTFQVNWSLNCLYDLGLIRKTLTDDKLLDRTRSVKFLTCSICAFERSGHLLSYLSENASKHENVIERLRDIEFLPIKLKPDNWHFLWHGGGGQKQKQLNRCSKHKHYHQKNHLFTCPQKMFYSDCTNLVGCLEYVLAEDVWSCRKYWLKDNVEDMKIVLAKIGMKGIPKEDVDYQIVTDQLISISSSSQRSACCDENKAVIEEIYQHLDMSCRMEGENIRKSLDGLEVVWTKNTFVSPKNVASGGIHHNCNPYLFKLTDSPLKKYKRLRECLGIRKFFWPRHVALSLQNIKNQKKKRCLTESEIETVINMLHTLKNSLRPAEIDDVSVILCDELKAVYGPDSKCCLRDMKEMCFNDLFHDDKTTSMIYCHDLIPKALAEVFGVMSKKIRLLEEDSEDVEDFCQEELLEVRLKRLVENYPCDSGIFKELIQNADDANATEIHFLKDFTTHPVKHIFDKSFEPLQGPALCVFNDSSFTRSDLDGIKQLGVGSKSRDPSKTGRYGVGFNAVYNLTDAPSLYSRGPELEKGETLFIFDPLAKYLPNVKKSNPGKRYKNVKSIRNHASDVMGGYHEPYFMKKRNQMGSVFRFPLRTNDMAKLSTIRKKETRMDTVSNMLDSFCKEMNEVLLFLKNLKTIKVSSFDKSYTEEFVIHAHMTEAEEKEQKDFFINEFAIFKSSSINDELAWERILQMKQKYVLYELDIQKTIHIRRDMCEPAQTKVVKKKLPEHKKYTFKDTITKNTKYIVVQIIGFKDIDKVPQIVQHQYENGGMDLLPLGGVALSIGKQCNTYEDVVSQNNCNVFCFLPLPVKTDLPLHVHGYFSLDHEIRRGLWKAEVENKCGKTLWNLAMIEQVIVPANVILIEYVKDKMFKNVLKISPFEKIMRILKNFQTLFPDREKVQDFYWQHMLKCVYKNLISENIPFLPVLETAIQPRNGSEKQRIAKLSWTALEYEGFTFKAFDNFESEGGNTESDFNNMLRSIGMRITTVSPEMKSSMKFAGVEISTLQPMHVIQFLCSFNFSSLDKCNIQTNKPIEKTSLKSKELLLQIAEYCLQDEEYFITNIKNIPLMLTQDLTIHTLQEQKVLFLEETGLTYNLFPSKRSMFLHKSVSKLIQTKITDYQIKTDETCRQFTLQDLANLVRETCLLDTEVCAITAWYKDNPSVAWIRQFWNLFFYLLPSTYKQGEDIMKKELKVIQDLRVIPVVDSLRQNTFLVKPLNKKYLINIGSFSQNECLHKAFKSLNLLEIDGDLFQHRRRESNCPVFNYLLNQIPKFDRAKHIVECLHLNLSRTSYSAITLNDSVAILKYFDVYLGLDTPNEVFTDKLAEIPIFVSHFNECLAIKGYEKVYVAPSDFPIFGLKDIARKTKTLVLKAIETDKIFRKLNIQMLTHYEAYRDLIIPHIQYIEDESIYKHLEFLANFNETNTQEVFYLLDLLRTKPLIYIKELKRRVKVSELFDPDQVIFTSFCTCQELVPIRYRSHVLLKFLRSLGLKTKMSIDLFLQFATDIYAKSFF
ncbi:sacsin-like [Ruditapes philippinarum]|uniref:sacsin-like n=1 Tax=Ruditapes philippinarum TaxID=129788 RepID=UPI00295AFC51|nr:sacsin-like [Ruditapes philippinarum]